MVVFSLAIPVVPIGKITIDRQWRFFIRLVDIDIIETVRKIIWIFPSISIHPHLSVSLVIVDGKWATVHRNLFIIDTQTIPLCIGIRQDTTLQHLVGRIANTIHNMSRSKSGLFNILKIILWILIQFQNTNIYQRKICMWPNLGQIEWVKIVLSIIGFSFGHDLDFQIPLRKISSFNIIE